MLGLFVYGTLHPGRAPDEVRGLVQRFVSLGKGTVMGRLLDLGEYPGLVLDGPLELVLGEVFGVPDDAWPALDAYEGFNADHPDASLFVRQLCAVRMDGGATAEHWVYVFHGGSRGRQGIKTGVCRRYRRPLHRCHSAAVVIPQRSGGVCFSVDAPTPSE